METNVNMSILEKIQHNIQTVIIGKDDKITLLLTALLARGHVLLEDTPGTGKTMLAKALAASINGSYKRVQFTPDLLPSDVTGMYINLKYQLNRKKFHWSNRMSLLNSSYNILKLKPNRCINV